MSAQNAYDSIGRGFLPEGKGPHQHILDTIDRLCESWRKGLKKMQSPHADMYTQGRMQQTEFAISLLLGVPSAEVHAQLMRTGGNL